MSSGDPTRSRGAGADRATGSIAGSHADLPVEQGLLLEVACDAFEAAWRAGSRPDVAVAILAVPEALRQAALRELVQLDAFYRRKAGEAPAASDYAGRFPELEPDWLGAAVAVEVDPVGGTRHPGGRPTDRVIGTVIAGRYTLAELLGEGGMGSVYRARQSEPVKRDVALKLIKGGLDSRTVLARFEAERQALALMDHPHIARVYDGGTTGSGRPFFVMELVAGSPITRYCDDRRLGVRSRLELFAQVCLAVQHAHQKGVIHRDLKPGNILVAEADGRPVPKVIDFGVAKAVGEPLTDVSFSDTGVLVGTPAYMSPEQADPACADIDTRTDVYALGVILYELLTGSPPLTPDSLKRGAVLEVLRMVREVEPPRPSTRLGASAALPSIAANRGVEPARLAKLLRGELDWVVMKALEKDRDRRYGTALGLAQDVQRYLADEVVEARPPGRAYRLRKFVRRNRGHALAAALIFVALVAGIVGTSLGMLEARREAGRAEREATEAKRLEGEERRAAARAAESEWRARRSATEARESEAKAKRNERLAKDSAHAIKIEIALQAWGRSDWARMKQLLDETDAEYGGTFENRFVRALWVRHTAPLRTIVLTGHAADAAGVVLLPDGRYLGGGGNLTARVWDADSGEVKHTLTGHTKTVAGVASSADGTRVVTVGADRTARVWDAATGVGVVVIEGASLPVALSPDGRRVAAGTGDRAVRVWDAATGAERLTLKGHSGDPTRVEWSPDGAHLVTVVASADVKPGAPRAGEVKLWDATSGGEVHALKGADYPRAAFSPDGKHLAVGDFNLTRVLIAKTGAEVIVLKHPHGRVSSLAFSPDGKHLATGAAGRTGATGVWETAARVWDLRTGAQTLTLRGHTAGVTGVAYSPDGARILTNSIDRTARVWDAESGAELLAVTVPKGHDHGAVFSTDGRRVVTRGGATVSVWDAETGPTVLRGHTQWVAGVAFSPDGKRIATASGRGEKSWARIWDATTGTTTLAFSGLGPVAFSPDGKRIVTGGGSKARVFDAESGAEKLLLEGHSEGITGVAFSPDGRRIATASSDGTSRVWDATTGAERLVFRGERGREYGVAFDRDGRLAVGSSVGPVRVYDSETGAEQLVLRSACAPVAFSSDGRLATGSDDGTARVWDAKTGAELLSLRGHTEPVSGIAFSPDGARIVTGCGDHRRDTPGQPCDVKVWDAESGTEKLTLRGHTDAVWSVAFSPDGRRIVTGSHDKTARVWDASRE